MLRRMNKITVGEERDDNECDSDNDDGDDDALACSSEVQVLLTVASQDVFAADQFLGDS